MSTNREEMAGSETQAARRRSRRGVRLVTLIAMVLGVSAVGAVTWRVWIAPPVQTDTGELVEAIRGPLTIDVSLSGQVQNRDLVKVRCEVEGRTSIIKLVEEGTHVKKGDLLVQLDASNLRDQREQQLLAVDKAEASWVNARETLAVTESRAASDVDQAKLDYEFAQIDLKKYIEGDYPQELKKAQNAITVAEEQLKRASERFNWSTRLKEKNFISEEDYEADRLSMVEKTLNLELAKMQLEVLTTYTRDRKVRELESDVDQTKAALERAQRKANADVVQAKAEFKSRESELARQKERLQKLTEQIGKCEISAPVDGMVVYATTGQNRRWSQSEPLAEGAEVRERQELIHLPVSTKMMAQVKVHESSLKKVKPGQRVRVTVDAQKGKVYWGQVGKIALLPDAQSFWMNPDLKVYDTEIYVDGDARDLRAGMSCNAQIIVAEYDDALYVPIQSVVRIAGKPVVFVAGRDGTGRRDVEIGLDNGQMVHIVSGLAEGEKVLLAPPLGESVVPVTGGIAPEGEGDAETKSAEKDDRKGPALPIDPEKLRNMSREERQKFFESLTPEQREQMRQRGGGTRRRRAGEDAGKDAEPPTRPEGPPASAP